MPYMTPEQREEWRNANRDLIDWLADHRNDDVFLSSVFDQLGVFGTLSDAQTQAVRRNMQEGSLPEPATADDCTRIFNGTYSMASRDHYVPLDLRVHTVQRGQLRGKRIIKRKMSDWSYKGFAFLTKEAGVRVWRRFADDEQGNVAYIWWTKDLFEHLDTRHFIPSSVFTFGSHGLVWTVRFTPMCRKCNNVMGERGLASSLGLCPQHRLAGRPPTLSPSTTFPSASLNEEPSTTTRITRVTAPIDTGQLTRSQVNPDEIQ